MLNAALKNGLASLMTAAEHGIAGVIEKVQQMNKEREKMKESYSQSKEKENDKSQPKSKDTEDQSPQETTNGSSIDMVNHPPHYASSKIECIDAMEAMTSQGREYNTPLTGHMFYLWQVIFKYIWRFPFKDNPVEDLKKTRFYLDRLIELLEKNK